MKISGIYQIQSLIKPERIYIGSAVNIQRRWKEHLYRLKKQNHDNSKLQNHFNKYGKEDLVFSIIIGCNKEDLICTEQFYLDSIKHWFNINLEATSSSGVKRSEAFCKKVGDNTRGRKYSDEVKKAESESRMGENNPFYGKHHTEKSNEKRREWNRLHPPTKESRELQRQSLIKHYENENNLLKTVNQN